MRRAVSPTDTQAGQDRCEAHHFPHREQEAHQLAAGPGEGGEPHVHPQRAGSPLWAPSPRSLSSPIPPLGPLRGRAGRGGAGRLPGGCLRAAGPAAPGARPGLAAAAGRARHGSDRLGSAGIGTDRLGTALPRAAGSQGVQRCFPGTGAAPLLQPFRGVREGAQRGCGSLGGLRVLPQLRAHCPQGGIGKGIALGGFSPCSFAKGSAVDNVKAGV